MENALLASSVPARSCVQRTASLTSTSCYWNSLYTSNFGVKNQIFVVRRILFDAFILMSFQAPDIKIRNQKRGTLERLSKVQLEIMNCKANNDNRWGSLSLPTLSYSFSFEDVSLMLQAAQGHRIAPIQTPWNSRHLIIRSRTYQSSHHSLNVSLPQKAIISKEAAS